MATYPGQPVWHMQNNQGMASPAMPGMLHPKDVVGQQWSMLRAPSPYNAPDMRGAAPVSECPSGSNTAPKTSLIGSSTVSSYSSSSSSSHSTVSSASSPAGTQIWSLPLRPAGSTDKNDAKQFSPETGLKADGGRKSQAATWTVPFVRYIQNFMGKTAVALSDQDCCTVFSVRQRRDLSTPGTVL